MMHTLGIAGDFGADHTGCVGLEFRPIDPSNFVVRQDLHLKRAGGRTVMRTGRKMSDGRNLIHRRYIASTSKACRVEAGIIKNGARMGAVDKTDLIRKLADDFKFGKEMFDFISGIFERV